MTSAAAAHRPKYQRIERELRQRIQHGDYTDWLPPERQLAVEFGTTAVTARQALAQLQREGLITRKVGHGTRIIPRAVVPIRIHLSAQSAFHAALRQHLQTRFPEERFDFLAGDTEAVLGQCDLMTSPSTFLHDYERYFAPVPKELAQQLRRRSDLPARYLDIHTSRGIGYGVPLLVSATGLEVNADLAAELNLPQDRPLELPALGALHRRLRRRRGFCLFDPQFVSTVALPHLLAIRTPLAAADQKTDWREALAAALDDFALLFAGTTEESAAFARGRALFRLVCRQNMTLAATQPPLPFPTRILPLFGGPFFPGYICSETLMVAREAPRSERLFQIAAALLEPAAQDLVSRHCWGFPVVAGQAWTSLQAGQPGDEVFFMGLERGIYGYPAVLSAIRPVLWALVTDVLAGRLSMERLRHDALAAYDAACLRWLSVLRFESRHAQLSRLGAIA